MLQLGAGQVTVTEEEVIHTDAATREWREGVGAGGGGGGGGRRRRFMGAAIGRGVLAAVGAGGRGCIPGRNLGAARLGACA